MTNWGDKTSNCWERGCSRTLNSTRGSSCSSRDFNFSIWKSRLVSEYRWLSLGRVITGNDCNQSSVINLGTSRRMTNPEKDVKTRSQIWKCSTNGKATQVPMITQVPLGFSRYIWHDTKIVLQKSVISHTHICEPGSEFNSIQYKHLHMPTYKLSRWRARRTKITW